MCLNGTSDLPRKAVNSQTEEGQDVKAHYAVKHTSFCLKAQASTTVLMCLCKTGGFRNSVLGTRHSKEVTPTRQSRRLNLKGAYHLWLRVRSLSKDNCCVFLGSFSFLIVFGQVAYTAISDLTWKSAAGWWLWGIQGLHVGDFLSQSTYASCKMTQWLLYSKAYFNEEA